MPLVPTTPFAEAPSGTAQDPQVGEVWEFNYEDPSQVSHVRIEKCGEYFTITWLDDGGGTLRGQTFGGYSRKQLRRRISGATPSPQPAPPTESEGFEVGDEVVCVDVGNTEGCPLRIGGRYTIGSIDGVAVELAGAPGVWNASRFRRLPAQPATEAKGTAAPVAKVDPYAEHRARVALSEEQISDEMYFKGRTRRRFTADQIGSIDLNRPLTPPRYPTRERGAMICRRELPVVARGKSGHPSAWPEGSDHE